MGRRLESATSSGGTKISYTYNADGLLTSKKKGSIEYYYYWNGDKLTAITDNGNTWYFRYDGDTPIGLEFDGIEYYYVTNLQGDIIAILNDSGECVAEYSYDAWGNCTITKDTDTIAYDNPLRYRGYYYDFDTGFYYLQSRYYDANTGRFINSDDAEMIEQEVYNLFTYCDNNPVNFVDYEGSKSKRVNKKTNYFIVYARDKSNNFIKQAEYMSNTMYRNDEVVMKYVKTKNDFKKAWNNMSNIGNVHLYLHGSPGNLCFYKENMSMNEISFLSYKSISGKVYLCSCNGGTYSGKLSVANVLSKVVKGAKVRAIVNGYVYYRAWYQLVGYWPLTKEKKAFWADFYVTYGKNTIYYNRKWVAGSGRMPF